MGLERFFYPHSALHHAPSPPCPIRRLPDAVRCPNKAHPGTNTHLQIPQNTGRSRTSQPSIRLDGIERHDSRYSIRTTICRHQQFCGKSHVSYTNPAYLLTERPCSSPSKSAGRIGRQWPGTEDLGRLPPLLRHGFFLGTDRR